MRTSHCTLRGCLSLVLVVGAAPWLAGQEYDRDPIRYTQSQPGDRVTQLAARVATGEVTLAYEAKLGYLRSLVRELNVPESSQTLVFSKTSLQRQRIAPRTPRAIYFNDDVYIGYCQQGEVIELSAVDPQLGAIFYTVGQQESPKPQFVRQTDNCLICHGSSQTKEVPGYVVRSVFVDRTGLPLLASGTYRTDHSSPLEQRWGGWYVTGTHGAQKHLGNAIASVESAGREPFDRAGLNVTNLDSRFRTTAYLRPTSDIVALMVLEHQADAHNLITRANYLTRQAVHHQDMLNRELGEPADKVWESTTSRIKSACEPLVEYLLMSGEARLTERIAGTSGFAEEFASQGPRDSQGRSLRELDLETRLFKYPCSYLVYSAGFKELPREARAYVFGRLETILLGRDTSPKFAHLSNTDRTAIREILQATLPGLPAGWGSEERAKADDGLSR